MQFSEFYINKDGFVLNVTFQKIFYHWFLETSSFSISLITFF